MSESNESYSVLIFSVGKNPTPEPKESCDPNEKNKENEVSEKEPIDQLEDNLEDNKNQEVAKKEYVPSPYENWFTNEKKKGIPFDDLHQTIEDGPITLNINGLGASGKEVYDLLMKADNLSNYLMGSMAVDGVHGLHQGRYRYDSTLCVMIELINGETVPGSKCDHFRHYTVFGETEHEFRLIRLDREVSERDRRILRSVAAKRTAISEYFGKFELFFSDEKVIDFSKFHLNETGFKTEGGDDYVTRDQLIRQTTLNRRELYSNLEMEFEDILAFEGDDATSATYEADFMVVASTHHTHLQQILKSLEFALGALEYEYELIDI